MPHRFHIRRFVLLVVLTAGATLALAQQPPPPPPGQQPPVAPAPAPGVPAPAPAVPIPVAAPIPGTVPCPAPVPPATVPARSFTATTGMLFHQVIPARMLDFERFLAYLRDALAKTKNPLFEKQAKGWTFYRTVEAGPNGDALYVFMLNPAVPCVDYALSPIMAEAYPDPAQLMEIWKLYTSSVRPTGSTLLTLVPAQVPATPALLTPPTTPAAPAGAKPAAGPASPPGTTQSPATTTPPAK